MSTTASDQSPVSRTDRSREPLGRIVEWAVAALLVFGGFVFAAIGTAVYSAADRSWLTTLVADGTIESTDLTDAELVDVLYGLAWWGGVALVVTGLLLAVAGVAFLYWRRRTRANRTDVAGPDTTTNAIVGGVVTVVASAVPFSPVLGGAIAGYLEAADTNAGLRVGAYAGLVAVAPLVVLFALLLVGLAVVGVELGLGAPLAIGAVGLFVGLLVTAVYMVGLSALGGYLGVRIAGGN